MNRFGGPCNIGCGLWQQLGLGDPAAPFRPLNLTNSLPAKVHEAARKRTVILLHPTPERTHDRLLDLSFLVQIRPESERGELRKLGS